MQTKPSSTNSSEPEDVVAPQTPTETTATVNNNTEAVAADNAAAAADVGADEAEDDPATLLNFTKVDNLDQERRVFELYKSILIYILSDLEKQTTLQQDLELLGSEDLTNWQMKIAVIYRSERKKIIHAQLHLVTWMQHVLQVCDQGPAADEFPQYFKFITFGRTAFEIKLLD